VVTDGAFLPSGRGFVLRDYQQAHVYAGPGRRVGSFDLPLQFQGESLAVTADGRSLLVGSEGPDSEVWRVPLPASMLARVAPPASTRAPAGSPEASHEPSWIPLAAWAAGIVLVLALGLLVRRVLRRHA
jgi:hypothetical protein